MIDFKKNMEIIAAIEQSFDVNSVCYGSFMIWPIIRLRISQQLSHPEMVFLKKIDSNPIIRNLSVRKNQMELFKKHINRDILFISRTEDNREQFEGKFYHPFIDPVQNFAQKCGYSCVKTEIIHNIDSVNQTLPRHEPPIFINPLYINREEDPINRIENFSELNQIVYEISNLQLDMGQFLNETRAMIEWQKYFKIFFSIVRPKKVFFSCVCYLIAMAFIRACKKLKITTVDIQHGRHGNYNESYTHWTKVPQSGYEILPDYYWCWGKACMTKIEKWYTPDYRHHRPIIGGNLRIQRWIDHDLTINMETKEFYDLLEKESMVILVILQGPDTPLPDFFFKALRESPKDWLWLIRLHPAHSRKKNIDHIIHLISQHTSKYEVKKSTFAPLYGLFKRVDHHITISSSTCYEALVFKVPSTIIDITGYDIYKEEIVNGVFSYADSVNTLLSSIKNNNTRMCQLSSDYIQTDLSVAQNAFKMIFKNSQHSIKSQIEFSNRNANAMNDLGESLFARGFIEAALKTFLRAKTLTPYFPVIYNNIGVLYWKLGKMNISLQYILKALELDYNDPAIIANTVTVFKYYGYYDQAKEIINAFSKRNPDLN